MTIYSVHIVWGDGRTTESSAYMTRAEAEAAIDQIVASGAERGEAGKGTRTVTHHDYTVIEVDMPARLCSVCGVQAISSTNPDTDFCRHCHYDGSAQQRGFAALCEEINASVWHTGGGCFALGIPVDDDRYLLATGSAREYEAALPADENGPWLVGLYEGDGDDGTYKTDLDRAGLIAHVEATRKGE